MKKGEVPKTWEAHLVACSLDMIKDDRVRNICADFAIRVIANTASIETTGHYATPEQLAYAAGRAVAAQTKKRDGKVIQIKPYLDERRRNEEP